MASLYMTFVGEGPKILISVTFKIWSPYQTLTSRMWTCRPRVHRTHQLPPETSTSFHRAQLSWALPIQSLPANWPCSKVPHLQHLLKAFLFLSRWKQTPPPASLDARPLGPGAQELRAGAPTSPGGPFLTHQSCAGQVETSLGEVMSAIWHLGKRQNHLTALGLQKTLYSATY